MADCSDPRVWLRYKKEKNGKTANIKIQNVTPELSEAAVEHMSTYFLKKEPLSSYEGVAEDPPSLADIQNLWRHTIKQGLALVALLEDGNNEVPFNIVGVNITGQSSKDKKKDDLKFNGERFKKVLGAVFMFSEEGNLYERYGVDCYLSALGLSVHPDYHGLDIGLKLLEAREPLCIARGLKLTATVFTAPISQHLAKKAGFANIMEYEYSQYKVNGKVPFPKLEGKMCLMVKQYE